jgi:outer membrane protein TolC
MKFSPKDRSMERMKPCLALFCSFLMVAPGASFAADQQGDQPAPNAPSSVNVPQPLPPDGHGLLGKITNPYRAERVDEPSLKDSSRLESLMRAGNIYLSLQDCIALALENNLDIDIQRYGPQIADAAVLQAEAGSFARGVSTGVIAGPSSATVSSSGTTPGTNQTAASASSSATSSAVSSSVLSSSGPSIPTLDPMLVGSASWAHLSSPQSNTITTGTNGLVQRQSLSGVALQKSFLTGTTVSLGLNNTAVTSNSTRNDFNPATNSSLALNFTQPLLQGFGRSVNSRQIRIARNNREVADLTFRLQVETTVAAVMSLYWNLVAFNENVRVAQESVASATRLRDDNKRQVEVGTLAPIEVTRAEAQIASGEQALTNAQTQVLQQETIIKTALSKTGVASPTIAAAHIITTDRIRIPDVEPIAPIQDLTALALSSRPELAQSRIQLQNQELTIKGSRNGMLPTLSLVGGLTNNALAGDANPLGANHSNDAFFLGGYSTVLSQLFRRNFPSYSAGLSLNIPIHNRAAQAQAINDQLTYRQQQLTLQRLQNNVRVDVQNALIALTQARAQYQSATKAHLLQAQTLDAEQKKLALGASTIYNVIADQQALAAAEYAEVQAEAAYASAKVELERSTGQILYNNDISIDEAYKGVVSRPPSPIPAAPPRSQQ